MNDKPRGEQPPMKKNNSNIQPENLSTGDHGIVDYHNNLVQIRFTVAGLSIAADEFLASGFFRQTPPGTPGF
jgi:hypothetical protein